MAKEKKFTVIKLKSNKADIALLNSFKWVYGPISRYMCPKLKAKLEARDKE